MTPVGTVTRGTTGRQRLRRVDRWLMDTHPGLLRRPGLLVVDLGYGHTPVTTAALHRRLREVNPTATVIGVEIDEDRVRAAQPHAVDGLQFARGGFELAGLRPDVVRALNVLRQYDEHEVAPSWGLMARQITDGGLLVEGTCDEAGRLGAWVSVDATGPQALTLALDLRKRPGAVAARLPKALIHRNVPGEPVHRLLADLDDLWGRSAPLGVFSRRQRAESTIRGLRGRGWPVLDGPSRWRRGEVTLAWRAVAPTQVRGESARSR